MQPVRSGFANGMPLNAAGRCREAIVRDDGDREMFVATLAEACKKTGWQVLAWVRERG